MVLMSALTVLMVGTAAWSLWVRKFTFSCLYERAATSSIIFLTLATVLISTPVHGLLPVLPGHPLGFAGHVLTLIGIALIIYIGLSRLADDESIQAHFNQWVVLPLTVALPVLLLLYTESSAPDHPPSTLLPVPIDFELRAYLTVLLTVKASFLLLAGRIFCTLRGQSPSATLDLCVGAIVLNLLGCATAAGTIISPSLRLFDAVWAAQVVGVILWNIAMAQSWKVRSRPIALPLCNIVIIQPEEDLCGHCPLQQCCPYEENGETDGPVGSASDMQDG
ncbi:hypothetical protein JRC04_05570 [Mycolicibacterium sp. S2-37]|uniref:hypothetical protein n=1 Tax=Mycolicibacterium sp. S2-37 TaxID=2810297 RepID=UPI001A94B9C8|nr:hypothetical protein [Mycolicibacterium sp. S2-37]MBO0676925.1 hypothetical protein [Mycolicibacterium sp. S2-37]